MRWELHVAGVDAWNVFHDGQMVALVVWIADLRHPMQTMARIADGLNGVHADVGQRTWSAELAVPHRWNLVHNGRVVGEFAWERVPRDEQRWLDRALQGLNWVPESRAFTPAEPLPPTRPFRSVAA